MAFRVWIVENLWKFKSLSEQLWVTSDGEIITRIKPKRSDFFHGKTQPHMKTTEAIGTFWERIVQSLLPNSEHRWRPHDILFLSSDGYPVWVEVKTSRPSNRGVIRPWQVQRYLDDFWEDRAYFASVFYLMNEMWIRIPELIYIFPIPVIIYLLNTIHKTWNQDATAFYWLSSCRARQLYDWLWERKQVFQAREFVTTNLPENPRAVLRVLDYNNSLAHILGLLDRR